MIRVDYTVRQVERDRAIKKNTEKYRHKNAVPYVHDNDMWIF
jgi:hypothetical protein